MIATTMLRRATKHCIAIIQYNLLPKNKQSVSFLKEALIKLEQRKWCMEMLSSYKRRS